MTETGQPTPWRKEPYVWMVIGFPAAAVVAGIITLILAIQSEDGLVVDDYYKRGLEINRILDRDRAAKQHQLDASVHYPGTDNTLMVVLSAGKGFTLPQQLTINLLHATRKGYDQVFTAGLTGEDQYIVPASRLQRGHWHILIETDEWRLLREIRVK